MARHYARSMSTWVDAFRVIASPRMSTFTFQGADDITVELVPVADCRETLFPEELALVAGAAPKRQSEFASGRMAARAAMRRHRLEPAAVLRNERAPLWPPGFVGSIAHSRTWAMAALMPRGETMGIGIDLEHLDRMKPEMLRLILTASELSRFAPPVDLDRASTVFSAKEAVYKAVHPLVGEFIGFKEVEVDLDRLRFRARYVGGKDLGLIDAGEGFIAMHEDFVATLFVLRRERGAVVTPIDRG